MVLRRDVACCVKVVAILVVDFDVENSRLLLMITDIQTDGQADGQTDR